MASADRRFLVYLGPTYTAESFPGNTAAASSYVLANWIEPTYLSVVANGEIGELRAICHQHPETARGLLPIGTPVQLFDMSLEDGTGAPVFVGVIVKRRLVWRGDEEISELVAYNNADFLLHRLCLTGQSRRTYAIEQDYIANGITGGVKSIDVNTDTIQIDTPIIFNPNGQPNMTEQVFHDPAQGDSTNTFNLFEVPDRDQVDGDNELEAIPWTLSRAVAYLFANYSAEWALSPVVWNTAALNIFTTNGDPVVSNVNLEGKSFLDGLRELLEPHNYGFYCTPDTVAGKHHLIWWFKGASTDHITLDFSARGTDSIASTANCIDLELLEDSTSTVNTIQSYGDRATITTLAHTNSTATGVLKLVQGWKTADLTWALDSDGVTVNPFDQNFVKNYKSPDLITVAAGIPAFGVGRYWTVNLGNVDGGTLEDLKTDFSQNNSIDARRFENPVLFNNSTAGSVLTQQDVTVEMSFDSGLHWIIVEKHWYRIMPLGLGIVFTEPRLERLGLKATNATVDAGMTYWQALHDSALQIRILCSVKSDQCVEAEYDNAGISSPLSTWRTYRNDAYQQNLYNSAINATIYYTNLIPQLSTQDDTSALLTITNQQARFSDRIMVSGSAKMVLNAFAQFNPGQEVLSITGRGITFTQRPTVIRVVYDFPNSHVHLVLDNHHQKTVIGKPIRTDDAAAARLHRANIVPLPEGTGNKVPFLPGVESSYRDSLRRGTFGGEGNVSD
jgi:hypothetical protein